MKVLVKKRILMPILKEHSHLPTLEEVFRSKVLSDQSTIATVRLVDGRTVAKYGRKVFVQEANAMILAASIGVPVPEGAYRYNKQIFIFMAFVPGKTLELEWDVMTAEQKDRLILDLREAFASLRKLTATNIGGVNMAPCGDPLFMSHPHVGPFENVSEFCDGLFSNFLHVARGSANSQRYLRRLLRRYEQYPIVFTHGDLSPRNVIVGDDHIACHNRLGNVRLHAVSLGMGESRVWVNRNASRMVCIDG
ncbi:hypothetical protein BT69DRAFT_1321978 [Atractiella rhizophila]|nr:hypothetical protein BT69DRAFT_1321978 [Atractiella rhizophila]